LSAHLVGNGHGERVRELHSLAARRVGALGRSMASMRNECDLLLVADEVWRPPEDGGGLRRRATPREGMLDRAYRRVGVSASEAEAVEQRLGIPLFLSYKDGARGLAFPHRPSLALADLATVAAGRGYEVQVVDNFMRWSARMGQIRDVCGSAAP